MNIFFNATQESHETVLETVISKVATFKWVHFTKSLVGYISYYTVLTSYYTSCVTDRSKKCKVYSKQHSLTSNSLLNAV